MSALDTMLKDMLMKAIPQEELQKLGDQAKEMIEWFKVNIEAIRAEQSTQSAMLRQLLYAQGTPENEAAATLFFAANGPGIGDGGTGGTSDSEPPTGGTPASALDCGGSGPDSNGLRDGTSGG